MLPSTMEEFSILTVCDFPSPILLLIWQNLNSLYFRTEWLLSLLFFLQPGVHFLKTVSKLPKSFRARRGFFKNSFLTIIAQFLCRSRATHFSISQGFQSLQSTFIKNHIFCSWTLLLYVLEKHWPWRNGNALHNLFPIRCQTEKIIYVTPLKHCLLCGDGVYLLPRPTPHKRFGSPSRVNSVKARQSEHARGLLIRQRGQRFSHINAG